MWNLWWVYRAVAVEGRSPYRTDYNGYPVEIRLTYHQLILPLGLLSIPLFAAGALATCTLIIARPMATGRPIFPWPTTNPVLAESSPARLPDLPAVSRPGSGGRRRPAGIAVAAGGAGRPGRVSAPDEPLFRGVYGADLAGGFGGRVARRRLPSAAVRSPRPARAPGEFLPVDPSAPGGAPPPGPARGRGGVFRRPHRLRSPAGGPLVGAPGGGMVGRLLDGDRTEPLPGMVRPGDGGGGLVPAGTALALAYGADGRGVSPAFPGPGRSRSRANLPGGVASLRLGAWRHRRRPGSEGSPSLRVRPGVPHRAGGRGVVSPTNGMGDSGRYPRGPGDAAGTPRRGRAAGRPGAAGGASSGAGAGPGSGAPDGLGHRGPVRTDPPP